MADKTFDLNAIDFYKILALERDATQEDIKRNYRKAAVRFHPDRNPGHQEEATENFKKVGRAYEVLMDPNLRKIYDEDGMTGLENYERMKSAGIDSQKLYKFFFGTPLRKAIFTCLYVFSGCCYCCFCYCFCCYGLCLPRENEDGFGARDATDAGEAASSPQDDSEITCSDTDLRSKRASASPGCKGPITAEPPQMKSPSSPTTKGQ